MGKKNQRTLTTHWAGMPEGWCAEKDCGSLHVSSIPSKVNCVICLHALGRRDKNHWYAVFCRDTFQSSHVSIRTAEDQIRQAGNGMDWHVRKWDVESKKWLRV